MSAKIYPVALSVEELKAVIDFHVRATKRIPKALGQAMLKHQATHLLPSGRAMKVLHDEAKSLIQQHAARVTELLSIFKAP